MDRKNLGLIAAGVAFYAIFSLFPGLAAVIALWGLVGDPSGVAEGLRTYEALLPDEVLQLIDAQLLQLAGTDGLSLGWASVISFLLALWSARAGAAALMRGLNAIYDVPNRQGLDHYLRAFALTLALIAVALTALLCMVVLPVALLFLPLGPWTSLAFEAARWVLAVLVLLAGFALVYRLAPNARVAVILPGAILAALLWSGASVGFSIYLANFGNYNEVYGSIGAVIALLMWLFISAWLVLLGGALNAWLGQREQPEPERSD